MGGARRGRRARPHPRHLRGSERQKLHENHRGLRCGRRRRCAQKRVYRTLTAACASEPFVVPTEYTKYAEAKPIVSATIAPTRYAFQCRFTNAMNSPTEPSGVYLRPGTALRRIFRPRRSARYPTSGESLRSRHPRPCSRSWHSPDTEGRLPYGSTRYGHPRRRRS